MARFEVEGGKKLEGEVRLSGNKNSALALIAASLLSDSQVSLVNVPVIRDVEVMGKIIMDLGGKVEGLGTSTLRIDPGSLAKNELNSELSGRIRASVMLSVPLLLKFGKAVLTPPGGDQIGERLLDTHFSMMKNFGVEIERENGKYLLKLKNKPKNYIFLEEASVTATEMALMFAANLNSEVVIEDCASEPHVSDLAEMLNKMGARVAGSGSSRLEIKGSKKLTGVEYSVQSDYIEGGTFIIASAITGGKVVVGPVKLEHYAMLLRYLFDMGVKTKFLKSGKIEVYPSILSAKRRKFQTRPWPGFPTDLMSPFIVLATQTKGTVLCHDWMYEWRMFFVDDLISMGANIFIADPHRVIVSGPTKLSSQVVYSKDIRAGISMILASLVAEGKSTIRNIEMIERGYADLLNKFKSLGASIKRID